MGGESAMNVKEARAVLGVAARATAEDVRRAFREIAKTAHPDRPGGDAERFRQAVEAHRRLCPPPVAAERFFQAPAPIAAEPRTGVLMLSPLIAMSGGTVVHGLEGGRKLRITLPPGLRSGDKIRAGKVELEAAIVREGAALVRGDDLWLTVDVAPRLLVQGGRIAVETPLGRRIVWIDRKAGARGLVRLVGQGLPARAGHKQGHLFLRLTPQAGAIDSAARVLLRRFAAAWAA